MSDNIDASIGEKLRRLRKMRGISLQQLADDTTMSYSFLSRLENGKHSISIVYLQRLAHYFEVDLIYFLDNRESSVRVMRLDEKLQYTAEDGISYSLITSKETENLQVTYYELPKNAPEERHVHKHHEGQELIITLDGAVSVMVDGTKYDLEKGDSMIFNSDVEHTIFTENKTAKIVIVGAPPYGRNINASTEEGFVKKGLTHFDSDDDYNE